MRSKSANSGDGGPGWPALRDMIYFQLFGHEAPKRLKIALYPCLSFGCDSISALIGIWCDALALLGWFWIVGMAHVWCLGLLAWSKSVIRREFCMGGPL